MGAESDCSWCQDRWGYSWQIVLRALLAAMNHSDKAVAKRAMDTMMTMKKINIAAIEAAVAQKYVGCTALSIFLPSDD